MKRNRVSINRVLDDRHTFGLAQVFHELWFSNNVLNPRKWRMWTWDKPYRFIIYQFIHIWWEDYLWIVTFNTGTVRDSLKYQSQYSYMYTYSSSVIRKELIKIENTLSTVAHAVWFIYVRKLLWHKLYTGTHKLTSNTSTTTKSLNYSHEPKVQITIWMYWSSTKLCIWWSL